MRGHTLLAAAALLGCLLVSCQAAGGHSRRLLQQTSYKNLLDAAQSEVRVIQQLYNGVFREQGWANTEDFRPLLKVALNPSTNLTAFFPSDDSWARVADYYCLSQQGVLDNISNLREMLANYIKAHLIGNVTLHSWEFKDGMVLHSMARPTTDPNGPSVSHTISKVVTNGTVRWVFKNASIYKIPGSFDYEDIHVNPQRMDIAAGNAVIHVMDTLFRNSETERFWEGLRSQVLERAGLPIDSRNCPANATSRAAHSDAFAPSQIAGMVIGVVIGLLLLAGVLMLIFVVRSSEGGFLGFKSLKQLSVSGGRRPGGGSSSPGDGDSPASGSGDVFTSPLLHLPHPASAKGSSLAQQSLLNASSLQTAGSWQSRASASNSTASMLVRPDSHSDFMTVVNEESPFAGARSGPMQQLPAAALAGPHVVRQTSSLAGDTVSDSSGGYHKTTDSLGSGTPFVSRGSAHGSKKDLLALAAGTHHGHQGSEVPEFDSLGGGLLPSESVPVGRINHEHVIPFSELTLKELIGSGAEGKVYRGTWKHTDIAAKEYLPIEPAQEARSSRQNSPSDAAMAHARAALAKEVHWLTSLNHPNLVRFCAVCLERPLVVMEFYKHGSVFAMLQKAARELARSQQARRKGYVAHFNWDRRLEMLHDVAAGMSYLHGKDHVHGDLRSPNLFVGADGKVKIGDFGFTKRLACNTASLKVKRITHPRWVAPELMMDNVMSRASDVYSFGIIMYELLTFRIPFDLLGKEQVVINVVQGFRPDVPEEAHLPPGSSTSTCLFTYVRLMKECWAHDPAQRPSFEVIARRLKAMQRWRKIISKHSTLHRAANALRHSSSSSSLSKEQQHAKSGSPQATGHIEGLGGAAAMAAAGGSAAASVLTVLGSGPATPALSRNRSGALAPAADSSALPPKAPVNNSAASQQQQSPAVPEYSSSEYDDDSLPELEDIDDTDNNQLAASAPVSEAVVQGTRLAVIGVCSHQDEADALASVAGSELALARKVVLVGSDLPAGAFNRPQSIRGMNSSEEMRSRRVGSAGTSFTAPGGPLLEHTTRFHSVTIGELAWQRQAHPEASLAAVTAATAALATATTAAAAAPALLPNGKAVACSRNRAAAVPAVKTGAADAAAQPAAAAPAAPAAAEAQQHTRRHSDPMPEKSRMSGDGATPGSPQCPESATAMSSGQSPFAFVHVGPPGLACITELQQMQLVNAKYQLDGKQQDPNAALRLLESYPLSNPESASVSPNRSAAATPELTGKGWGPHHGLHLQKQDLHQAKQQQQQQLQSSSKQEQLWRNGSSSSSGGDSSEQPHANGISRHRQQEDRHLQQQQQQGVGQSGPQAETGREQSAFESSGAVAAAATAASAAGEGLVEVYTPYDSPFFQDLDLGSWAPSASVCGLESQPNSLSARVPSAAMMAAGVVVFSSDSGSAASPFVHLQQQWQQAGLRNAVLPAGSGSVAGTEDSIVQPDGSTTAAPSPNKPVLREALTIEYQAGMTPMAAAAAEAVSVQASRRSISAGPGSQPASRPVSVSHGGPYAAAAAAVAAAVASGALPVSTNSNGAAAGSNGGSSGHSSQADVAASADNGGPEATAAANVLVDGFLGKAHSAPAKSPPRGTTPVSDQQHKPRGWRSHIDAPKAAAAAAYVDDDADGGAEPVRPAWMRLLGIRRSLPSGA